MHLIGLLTLQHLTGHTKTGGGERDRTDGLLRARQALSQLSYTPISGRYSEDLAVICPLSSDSCRLILVA